MKKIEAIIKPFKLEDVKDALGEIGIEGMTVSEVSGFGRQFGGSENFNHLQQKVSFIPKLMLEVVVNDNMLDEAVKTIMDNARTGKIGDGKIFIFEVEDVIRIRTEQRGNEAV
ncbi:MAG: P-II family nitrogen regulator [Verrucomicrobiota bacterium]